MDVKKVTSYMAQKNQALENRALRPEAQAIAQRKNVEAEAIEDRVAFSQKALEMARNKVTMERDDVRVEKVEALRRQIQEGSYTVDAQKIAARMLDEII